MTVHNGRANIKREWRKVKAKLIERYGTVEGAAADVGCHFNSIRNAVEGRSPGIAEKLKRKGIL